MSFILEICVVTLILGVVWFKVVLPVMAWVFRRLPQ